MFAGMNRGCWNGWGSGGVGLTWRSKGFGRCKNDDGVRCLLLIVDVIAWWCRVWLVVAEKVTMSWWKECRYRGYSCVLREGANLFFFLLWDECKEIIYGGFMKFVWWATLMMLGCQQGSNVIFFKKKKGDFLMYWTREIEMSQIVCESPKSEKTQFSIFRIKS